MFRQVLYVQWKWARLELIVCALAAFLIPPVVMNIFIGQYDTYYIRGLLSGSEATGVFYVALALVVAVMLAARPWNADASLNHVYALSLPVSWSEFTRYRFLAGALLLVVPAITVWISGIVTAASITIPPTLQSYPASLAIRFLLMALVLYSAVFALQYLAGKRAAKLGAWVLFLLLVLAVVVQLFHLRDPFVPTWNALTSWPGPFRLLTARWMLIDV